MTSRADRLKALRAKHAKATRALEKDDSPANQAALDDVEAELANAESDARDDERLASITKDLMPLVHQLAATATGPTRDWVTCVQIAAAQLEDAQAAKKSGAALDADRLAGQAEQLIEAVTRLRPS